MRSLDLRYQLSCTFADQIHNTISFPDDAGDPRPAMKAAANSTDKVGRSFSTRLSYGKPGLRSAVASCSQSWETWIIVLVSKPRAEAFLSRACLMVSGSVGVRDRIHKYEVSGPQTRAYW